MNRAEDEGIETSLDMRWVMSLQKKVSDTQFRDRNREPTIYRVPKILKNVDTKAYEPLLISLGPYHHNKSGLKAMNRLKWKYLKFVLEQTSGLALEKYLCEIKNLEKPARDVYSEEVEMSSKDFVEMMLLDGCFVMLTIMQWSDSDQTTAIEEESTLWTRAEVVDDIFKLENQLPFFLLETLYKSAFPEGKSFRYLTWKFVGMHASSKLKSPSENVIYHHIIHFFLSCIDPTTNNGDGNQSSQEKKKSTVGDGNPGEGIQVLDLSWIPSATILNEAGIHFVRKHNAKSFLDITFHCGKLEIPQLQIDDSTNSIWRNLIAYEQCSMSPERHVTAYTRLMDRLIDSAADMDLLQQDDIIINSLGDNQEVATLFNKIGMHVVYEPGYFYLKGVVNAIKKHRDTGYNKWRAKLNRDYFGNPWAVISLFGALLLFGLTVIQTIYAILSYVQ